MAKKMKPKNKKAKNGKPKKGSTGVAKKKPNIFSQLYTSVQRRKRVYDTLFLQTGPFTFDPPWEFLKADEYCRGPITDETGCLEVLQKEHSREHLLEAGVVEEDPHDPQELKLDARLVGSSGPLVFLRVDAASRYDVVTAEGTCLSGARPLFAMARDSYSGRRMRGIESNRVMGVTTMWEVAWLRAIGMQAAPMTDLANLNDVALIRLMELVAATPRGCLTREPVFLKTDLFEDHTTNYMGENPHPVICLQLTASAPGRTDEMQTRKLVKVIENLNNASRYLRIEWNNISVWWPDDRQVEELEYRSGMRSAKLLLEIFGNPQAVYSLQECQGASEPPAPAGPAELLEQKRQLMRSEPRWDDAPGECLQRRQEAVQEYQGLIDQHLVQPLINEALQHHDPITRQLEVQLAEKTRQLHMLSPVVQELVEQIGKSGGNPADPLGIVQSDAWKMQQRFVQDQLRLARELRR